MTPPFWSRQLLRRLSTPAHRDDIDGDLLEWFAHLAASRGTRHARWMYRRIVFLTACDCVRKSVRPARHIRALSGDIRIAGRRLRRAPGVLLAAVLTIGVALGANALMFGAVNGFLFRPLPFHDDGSIVWIFGAPAGEAGERGTTTGGEGDRIARVTDLFAATAAIGDSALIREVGTRHYRWRGIWATRGLFDVLAIRPLYGLMPMELPAGDAPQLMLLGHSRWKADFSSDPAIVGQVVSFADNKRFLIAGVLPAALEFPFGRAPHRGHGAGFVEGEQDFWILAPDRPGSHPGGIMVTRLAEGRTIEHASAALRADDGRTLTAITMRDQVMGPLAGALPQLQLFALFVLVVAGANVASLMLSRAVAAGKESTLRLSLGARMADLVRLAGVEAALIVAAGLVIAVVVMKAGVLWLQTLAPRHGTLISLVAFDGTVMMTLAVAGGLIALGLAAIPVLGGRSARVTRALNGLVAGQLALSVALVSGAGVLALSLHRVLALDTGYDASDVVAAETILYIPAREARPIVVQMVARLQSMPGAAAVGFVHSTPLTGSWVIDDQLRFLGGAASGQTVTMSGSFVAYDYFDAMRIGIVAGRTFTPADLDRLDFPIIINDVAARRYFPNGGAVGSRVYMTDREREVVGVVRATRDERLEAEPEPQWYQPGLFGTSHLLVRITGASDRLDEIRQVITSADPRVIIQRLEPMSAIVSDQVLERRLTSRVLLVFGAVAVLLAAIGLFGVTRFGTLHRRREFGVRVALGATRQQICGVVLWHAVRTAGIGIAIGCLLSALVMAGLQHLVFDARALDYGFIAGAALLSLVLSIVAAGEPAWRAAAVDPLIALKRE